MIEKVSRGGGLVTWVACAPLLLLSAVWVLTTTFATPRPPPSDGYQLIGLMYAAPQLWVSACAVVAAWHFSTLKGRKAFSRPSALSPIRVIARNTATICIQVVLSVVIGYLTTAIIFGVYQFFDLYLLLVLMVMGLGGVGLGMLAGMYLPKIWGVVIAFLAMFCLTYIPTTSQISLLRSLVGGSWAPSAQYQVDGHTLLATSILFGCTALVCVALSTLRVSGYKTFWPLTVFGSLFLVAVFIAPYLTRAIGYVPLVAREVTTQCTHSQPRWCVLPANAAALPTLESLNARIKEVEGETGARWPTELTEQAPPGPAPSTNVDALSPMYVEHPQASRDEIARTAVTAMSGLINPCGQTPPYLNTTAGVLLEDWWLNQILNRPVLQNRDPANDVTARAVLAMTPQEQGQWANSVLYAPAGCTVPIPLPGISTDSTKVPRQP